MSIVTEQRLVYESAWSLPAYAAHSPGAQHVTLFQDMTDAAPGSTVLDAGCGSGKGAIALRSAGFTVTLSDFTRDGVVADARALPFREACLWHLTPEQVGRFDYAYCCDVLEHIPTEYTMLVISRLLGVATRGVFLSIALVPDQFGAWVGHQLHQTVRDFVWWRDRLADLGRLVECRDLGHAGVYVVRAR